MLKFCHRYHQATKDQELRVQASIREQARISEDTEKEKAAAAAAKVQLEKEAERKQHIQEAAARKRGTLTRTRSRPAIIDRPTLGFYSTNLSAFIVFLSM